MCVLFVLLCLIIGTFADDAKDVEKKKVYPQSLFDLSSHYFKLVSSLAKKDGADEAIAKYDGQWAVEIEGTAALDNDYSLVLKSKAKHHAIATKLSRPIRFDQNELVVQYEVKFANGIDCGGAYLKLISDSPHLDLFHFIVRYKNPKTGEIEEKHAKKVTSDIDRYFSDKRTHLYTLVLRSDNTFERYIDQVKVQSGSLLKDMEPPINPPAEIDDPNDKRPDDWDERETIVDSNASKPDDWDEDAPEYITDETATKPEGWLDDEPEMVPDPDVEKPKDWDSEMDGEWEAPLIKNKNCENAPGCGEWHKPQIKNPNYKGKWSAPLIPNPAFRGIWKPAKIPNPNYFKDEEPFKGLTPVSAVGMELWSMTENIVFDNFLIVDSLHAANEFARETWVVKSDAERLADPKAHSVVDAVRETYKEKPFLVFGIGLACAIPLLLCLWYMCRPATRAPVAVHKKTDALSPDDEPTKYDAPRSVNTPRQKVDANEDEEEEADEEEEEETEDDLVRVPTSASGDVNTAKVASGKADLESDSNEESAATKTEPSQSEKQTVHKRRSRKE
ncbi:calnexin [Paragonimus westermani]|uniref:Calnexin n=1 Tax=Paragonimus westermani TaxID=34504 RepID=A0A5J4NBV9_9TREM|nr:calnexin [Paragonimus westermani]